MATSGVTTFNPQNADLIEQACTLAGFEARTGYDFRTARFALNMLFQEWANIGLNLWTLDNYSTDLTAGTSTYNLPVDTVDTFEVVMRTDEGSEMLQSDLQMNRISMSVYSSIPNKLTQGRPIQYMINRQIQPTITYWPVPDDTQTWTAVVYYLRRMDDTGQSGQYTLDTPARFYPAMLSGLAYQMCLRKPGLEARLPLVQAEYARQLELATGEDREKAPIQLVPFMGPGSW